MRATKALALLMLTGALLVGCEGKEIPTVRDVDDLHIMKFLTVWSAYKQSHNGRAPADEKELKAWAKTLKPDRLAKLGLKDIDSVFNSPRDGQPYALVKMGRERGGMSQVLAYERTGVDGKRKTVSTMGSVSDMDEATFSRAVKGP